MCAPSFGLVGRTSKNLELAVCEYFDSQKSSPSLRRSVYRAACALSAILRAFSVENLRPATALLTGDVSPEFGTENSLVLPSASLAGAPYHKSHRMLSRIVDDVISQSAKPRKARHVTLNRWFEIGIGARTGSAFGDTVSVSQARTAPAIDFECSLFRASSSRLTGPRVPQKPLPELRQMRSEPTVCLLGKSTVYGLNGRRAHSVMDLSLATY